MTHTVTSKLNKDARQHPNQSGVTFFVSLGEKNYNFRTKQSEYTNYEAALFAKENQVQFYSAKLVAGAVVSVTGTGLIIEPQTDSNYQPRLQIQDAKLTFVHSSDQPQQAPQQQAPQQQYQQPPQQQAPAPQSAPGMDDFDDGIPF
jgi:hypothetical protein